MLHSSDSSERWRFCLHQLRDVQHRDPHPPFTLTAQHSKHLRDLEAFQTLALSGSRYKKSDVREIYLAGRRNSAGLTGGLLGAGRRRPRPRGRLVRVALAARILVAQTQGVSCSGTKALERNEFTTVLSRERYSILAGTQV